MAETTYYVDTDVVGGSSDGSSWANAYSSLNQAEQARDADITGGNAVVFRCRASAGTADTTAAAISGWTTDADSYVSVYCDAGDTGGRHAGVWNTSKYRLTVANAVALYVSEEYVRVDGLQVAKTASDANLEAAVTVSALGASNDIRISNCILWGDSDATYTQPVLHINDSDAVVSVWNCICYSSGGASSVNSSAILFAQGASGSHFYSCTCIGARRGIYLATNLSAIAKNCYFYGPTAGVGLGSGATLTQTTCVDTTTAPSTSSGPYFTNVTAGSEDYRIGNASSTLIGAGTTLTDDPPGSTALGVDIAGTTRT